MPNVCVGSSPCRTSGPSCSPMKSRLLPSSSRAGSPRSSLTCVASSTTTMSDIWYERVGPGERLTPGGHRLRLSAGELVLGSDSGQGSRFGIGIAVCRSRPGPAAAVIAVPRTCLPSVCSLFHACRSAGPGGHRVGAHRARPAAGFGRGSREGVQGVPTGTTSDRSGNGCVSFRAHPSASDTGRGFRP